MEDTQEQEHLQGDIQELVLLKVGIQVLELLQDKEVTLVVVEPDQVTQEDQEDILRDSHMEEGHHRLPEPGRHQDRAMEEVEVVEVEEVILRAKDKWIPKLLSGLTL